MLALIDYGIELWMSTPFKRNPGCAAVGCFASEEFRRFWGIENMVTPETKLGENVLCELVADQLLPDCHHRFRNRQVEKHTKSVESNEPRRETGTQKICSGIISLC